MGRPNRTIGLGLAASVIAAVIGTTAFAKGIAPQSASCDRFATGAPSWSNCIGLASAAQTDDELFYAGYWLAKTGRYGDALRFLNKAQVKDERVLTYIGFATRKSGNIKAALGYYDKALVLNPDYTIARSYLGEAHLSLGNFDQANTELSEIKNRCGTSCAEYKELQDAIAQHEAARS